MVAAPWILPAGLWVAAVIGKWFEGIASTIKVLTHGPWKQTSCQPSVVKNSGPHSNPYRERPPEAEFFPPPPWFIYSLGP